MADDKQAGDPVISRGLEREGPSHRGAGESENSLAPLLEVKAGTATRQAQRLATDENQRTRQRRRSQELEADDDDQPSVPDHVAKAYVEVRGKYYFAHRPDSLAFVDKGARLQTRLSNARVAGSMVDIAESRGWTELQVRGTTEFRREAWLQASARGLEVRGYRPREEDLARLKKLTSDRQANEIPQRERTDRADALGDEGREAGELVREHPELVNEVAAIKVAEKWSARALGSEEDRERFMQRVRGRVAGNVARGEPTSEVKLREERTIERANRENESER